MNDRSSSRPDLFEFLIKWLFEELKRCLIWIAKEFGENLAGIRSELEAIRVHLLNSALLRPPGRFYADDNLGPGFETP
jgi:hypothetical protein